MGKKFSSIRVHVIFMHPEGQLVGLLVEALTIGGQSSKDFSFPVQST